MKQKLIKTEKDFNGYWVKGIKTHVGHEGETLVQCSVYKDGKRFAFYSDGDWGGPAIINPIKPEHAPYVTELEQYAATLTDYKYEKTAIFISSLIDAADVFAQVKKKCKTYTLFVTPECKDGEFYSYKIPYQGNEAKVIALIERKYKEYIIINTIL